MISPKHAARLRVFAVTAVVALAAPTMAHADPITTLIVSAINVVAGAGIAAAVGNFLVVYGSILYQAAATFALSKVSGSKAAAARDRQASVQQLSVGEVPREAIVGEAGTGGSLVDAYWFGGANGTDWNVLVIAVADHRCHSLVGFYEGDNYRAFSGDGFVAGYNNQLRVYWRAGTATDAALPSDLSGLGPATATGALQGVARVIVAYKADAPDAKNPIWTTGRPSFLWVVKGLLCYDPRKDSTVPGGSGAHRWDDPSTREWTENTEICRYNISRGVYFLDQVDQPASLMLGRGLSAYEAPPARVFAPANLCDEVVSWTDTATGLTYNEPRYRVGGVISADQDFNTVEQWFADAMAGFVIQPEGGVAVEPGQAKSPVAAITDDDLVVGGSVQWSNEVSDADRINSVVVSYVEPSQKFAMTTAGVLRDDTDILSDGGPKETSLSLNLVRHRSQALRIGEIKRRGARLERRGLLTLPPKFAGLEEGDWITYTSDYRTKGETVTMRVNKYALDEAWRNTLVLEETAYAVYGFGALAVEPAPTPVVTPVGALALAGVAATAITLTGTDGSALPAVRVSWTTPVDAAITQIRAEIRPNGGTDVTPTTTGEVSAGVMNVTAGVPSSGVIQVRLVPLGAPGRAITPSSWITLTTGALVAPPLTPDTTPPGAPSSISADTSMGSIFLRWTDPSDADLDKIELWESSWNDRFTAQKVATVAGYAGGRNGWTRSGLDSGVTRYYALRAIDRSGNVSGWYPAGPTDMFAATTDSLAIADFPADLEPVGVFPTLPSPSGYAGPKTIRVASDGKLYRYVAGAWVTGVAAADIAGTIGDSQIAALSAVKLAGQITTTQIQDGSIQTPKLAAGSVAAGKIAAGAVSALEIQSGAITTTKLAAGAVTANEIAAGSITGDRLTAGTVSAAYIGAGAVSTDKLAAGAVTADKVSAFSITADRLVTGQLDTYYIKAGAIANAGLVDWSGSTLLSASAGSPSVIGSGISVEVRGGGGAYTTIQLTYYVAAVNDDLVNQVGLWINLAVTGGFGSFFTGWDAALVEPGNPATLTVPVHLRLPGSGYINFTPVAFANPAGGSPQLYVNRVKLLPTAIYNG
ncbi:phage tail protein [Caulobacter vibrioides]|nr:phage tail protein [Caulobacter vibrioides]